MFPTFKNYTTTLFKIQFWRLDKRVSHRSQEQHEPERRIKSTTLNAMTSRCIRPSISSTCQSALLILRCKRGKADTLGRVPSESQPTGGPSCWDPRILVRNRPPFMETRNRTKYSRENIEQRKARSEAERYR
jgi:hypothetical protein